MATVMGIGRFREVDALAETMTFERFSVRVLTVDGLILAKTVANRPKDGPGLIELEAIRQARAGQAESE
jgi:hypothetical protein